MPVTSKGRKPRNPKTKPFFPHASGYWAAKIGGRTRYLARWSTPVTEVEEIYNQRRAEAEAEARSEQPVEPGGDDVAADDEPTVKDVANYFVHQKCEDAEAGDITWVTWAGYKRDLEWFVAHYGGRPVASLGPEDFTAINAHLKRDFNYRDHERRVTVLRRAITSAHANGYIELLPRFGTRFRTPGVKQYRRERSRKPAKLFSASELRALVTAADERMKAMVLLGINCGFLQSDLAALPVRFETGRRNRLVLSGDAYIRFDRPKTGERRKCALWPETVAALREVVGRRRKGLVFQTRRGQPLVHNHRVYDEVTGNVKRATNCDAVVKAFRELCQKAECYQKGRGFSALRSTFETRAWQVEDLRASDQAAIHWIMGHRLSGPDTPKMADVYVQDIDVAALRRVTEGVREWYLHAK